MTEDRGDRAPWTVDPWDRVGAIADLALEEVPDPGRRWAGTVRTITLAFCGVLLAVGALGFWAVRQLNPAGEPGTPVSFTVNEEDDIDAVVSRLADAGIIVNETAFRWYIGFRGGFTPTPGYYTLRARADAGEVLRLLSTPPSATFVSVTFPEGMTIEQMAARLAEKLPFMDPAEFLAAADAAVVPAALAPGTAGSLEGLLFPDTYQVSGDDTEQRVVARLVAMMERVARQEALEQAPQLVGVTQYEALVVASLVEREAKVPEDRAKIARVIYNRLAKGMKLEIDASLLYRAPAGASFADLKARDTPWNTYLRNGLPPTPIANPGRASIRAALAPAPPPARTDEACAGLAANQKCEYLYYVLIDKDGRHAFATTFAQHLANIEKARAAGILP